MRAEMMKAKESGSALQRLDARIKAMESRLESLKALKPVTEALYARAQRRAEEKSRSIACGGCGMM